MKEASRHIELLLGWPGPVMPRAYRGSLPAVVTASGLTIEDTVLGDGALAAPGRTVKVHYSGWLAAGRKFDSSRERGQAFEFSVGAGRVIAGWDEGVQGMRVGGRRRLTVPPHLGYGVAGWRHTVPPNATLVFDLELLSVA